MAPGFFYGLNGMALVSHPNFNGYSLVSLDYVHNGHIFWKLDASKV
jgi:hypothetical protein